MLGLGHVYLSHPPKRGGGNPARSGSEGAPQLGEGFPPPLNASPGRERCLCPSCPGATWQPRRPVPQCRGLGRTAARGGAGAQAEALRRGVWTTAHLLILPSTSARGARREQVRLSRPPVPPPGQGHVCRGDAMRTAGPEAGKPKPQQENSARRLPRRRPEGPQQNSQCGCGTEAAGVSAETTARQPLRSHHSTAPVVRNRLHAGRLRWAHRKVTPRPGHAEQSPRLAGRHVEGDGVLSDPQVRGWSRGRLHTGRSRRKEAKFGT